MKYFRTTLFSIGCTVLSFHLAAFPGNTEVHAETSAYTALGKVQGVRQPVMLLDGAWQFRFTPSGEWSSIQVPGEAAMQGFAIEHDTPYLYRKTFTVPADYRGKRTILRFDGVYSHARLTVNGTFVREHKGGFTRWETDVTSFVKPGKQNVIELEITDSKDDISYASGYAHHTIGGILRSVTLLAQPEVHLADFYVETHLDSLYRDAILKVGYKTPETIGATLSLHLVDPWGKEVKLATNTFALTTTNSKEQIIELSVTNPLKWDAEHPNLYTLTVSINQKGREQSCFSRQIGFRDIKIVKDRMLVNGQPVKLRGACRHDIHPTLGRTTTSELDSLDVVRFKESNMNFVRTSHYPPSEKFLEYCDRMGIYVECETAVCFVNTYRQKNYGPAASQNDSAYTSQYLSQCREMVNSFRSHASILFWSIGNESIYGTNFQQCWDWVKATDETRPVIFSYPGSVSEKKNIYDILSMHYQDVNGNISQFGMGTTGFQGHGLPALYDEWAHPACYTYQTLQEDPNIREFWGISLDKMWSGLFAAPGGLGGAIWGYIDETFMLPEPKAGKPFWKEFAHTAKPEGYRGNCVGYGEWGIVDVWRRPKPEFWSTKKAYSPVKLLSTNITDFVSGERLLLPIHNRFDHTNLNEIQIRYTYNGVEKETARIFVEPHHKGVLVIPAEDWMLGDKLLVHFLTSDGRLIDAEQITLGQEKIEMPVLRAAQGLMVEETADYVRIKGNGFEIPFHKATGLIRQAISNGQVIIEKGPFLHLDINLNHLTGAEVRKSATKFLTQEADWRMQQFAYEKKADRVSVTLAGLYNNVEVDMHITVFSEGRMEMDYLTNGEPNGYLRETGLLFYLPKSIQQLNWKRKGYWSYYPASDFAGNEGKTSLYGSRQVAYGMKPLQPWSDDTHNYYYWADAGANSQRPLTQKAKGMKENIYYYTLSDESDKSSLSVVSPDASVACRTNKRGDEQLLLYVNNRWDYPEIAWGNYCKTLESTPCFGKVTIQF